MRDVVVENEQCNNLEIKTPHFIQLKGFKRAITSGVRKIGGRVQSQVLVWLGLLPHLAVKWQIQTNSRSHCLHS